MREANDNFGWVHSKVITASQYALVHQAKGQKLTFRATEENLPKLFTIKSKVSKMTKALSFGMDGIKSLTDLFGKGIKGYATNADQRGNVTALWLFICDGTVLKICSIMTDIGGWDEVGTLVFNLLNNGEELPKMISLDATWVHIACVERMVLDEVDLFAESGLSIKNSEGQEILIVCGANVYSIQIAAPFFAGDFQPEYEISKYKQLPLKYSSSSPIIPWQSSLMTTSSGCVIALLQS